MFPKPPENGLVVSEETAVAIYNQRQHGVIRHYQCRANAGKPWVLASHVPDENDPKVYNGWCIVKLKTNVKITDAELLTLASKSPQSSLPTTEEELQALKVDWPNKAKFQGFSYLWELEFVEKWKTLRRLDSTDITFVRDRFSLKKIHV